MPEVEFVVFEPMDCRMAGWFSGLPNVRCRATPIPSEGRWGKLFTAARFWGEAFRRESFDLFEGFHLPFPKVSARKAILTVHDVRRLHPDWGWMGRTAFKQALTQAVGRADTVVTVSEAMRQELLPYCGQTPVCVIPNGIETEANEPAPTAADLAAFRRKLSLPADFLLAVGHLEQRKNYTRLIEALVHLRDAGRVSHLLIVGNESGERAALQAQIASCGLTGSVTIASGLSDMEVRCAYALCELFVFPSTYEGFGIPILEAMAANRPMALSEIPVFREITQGRSAYFSPVDAYDMARTILKVLSCKEEQERLIISGMERIKVYDYSHISLQYQYLYEILLK
jgi:glycosyltransferase involved in cell wall biosynthesis